MLPYRVSTWRCEFPQGTQNQGYNQWDKIQQRIPMPLLRLNLMNSAVANLEQKNTLVCQQNKELNRLPPKWPQAKAYLWRKA